MKKILIFFINLINLNDIVCRIMKLQAIFALISLLCLIGLSVASDPTEIFVEREPAIQTMIGLTVGYNSSLPQYRIYLDDPFDYPDHSYLTKLVQEFIPESLSYEQLLAKVKPLESKLKDQILDYLNYFSQTVPTFNFSFTENRTQNLVVFTIDHDIEPRGYTNWGGINNAIVFRRDYEKEMRKWLVLHEMMHGFLDLIHDVNGEPISQLPINNLRTENSLVLYADSSTWLGPGSRKDDLGLLYLGEFDWSIIQERSPVINPTGNLIELELDGLGGRRGSPGPMEWFSKIVVGREHSGLPDFITTWHEIFVIIGDLTDVWWIGFVPYWNSDTKQTWEDLWNFDEATVSIYPGHTLIKYRSDHMSGPSFDPNKVDSPLWVEVKHVKYADCKLYGLNRSLELTDIDKARIEVGPELIGTIYGFDADDDYLVFPNNSRFLTNLTCVVTVEGDRAIITWRSVSLTGKIFPSWLEINGVDSCDIRACGGPNNIYGDCPSFPGRSWYIKGTTITTMYMPVIAIGAILFGLIICICICFCLLFLILSMILIVFIMMAVGIISCIIRFGIFATFSMIIAGFIIPAFKKSDKNNYDWQNQDDVEMEELDVNSNLANDAESEDQGTENVA